MGGTLANKVGVEYKAKDSDINYVMHKIIHGVIGGISGLISGGTQEAFASAIGATIGEIVGEKFEGSHQGGIYDPEHPSYDAKEREAMVRKGTLFSELSAAVFAGILGQDPNAAARAANTAVTENAFSLTQITNRQTIKNAERAIDNSTTDTIEGLAEDFYCTLMNMPELDLTEDQAWDTAFGITEQIWEHPKSLSSQDLNRMVYSNLFNLVVSTPQQSLGIQDPEILGGQVFNSVESFLHEHNLPTMEGTYRLGEQFIDYTVDGIQSVGYSGEEVGRDVGAFLTENSRIQQVFADGGYYVGMGFGYWRNSIKPCSWREDK